MHIILLQKADAAAEASGGIRKRYKVQGYKRERENGSMDSRDDDDEVG